MRGRATRLRISRWSIVDSRQSAVGSRQSAGASYNFVGNQQILTALSVDRPSREPPQHSFPWKVRRGWSPKATFLSIRAINPHDRRLNVSDICVLASKFAHLTATPWHRHCEAAQANEEVCPSALVCRPALSAPAGGRTRRDAPDAVRARARHSPRDRSQSP